MNADIKPFRAFVKSEFLQDMDEANKGEMLPCTVFGATSNLNETVTFQILLKDGAMFSYMPLHALALRTDADCELDLADLAHYNCNTTEIQFHVFEYLKGAVQCFFKRKNKWIRGEYHGTIDFTNGTITSHLAKLENGQIALVPTHKIKFKNGERELPAYKKLTQTWKI